MGVLWKVCAKLCEFSLEKEFRVARCTSWVQVRPWDGDGYLGVQAGTEDVRDRTQAPLPGFPGYQ